MTKFPRKDGFDPKTQHAMLALFIVSFFTMTLGIFSLCKISRRKKHLNIRVILFFLCAYTTLLAIMLYCLTAFESGSLDQGCFTTGIQIAPSWSYILTSTMYLWNQIKFYRVESQVSVNQEIEKKLRIKHSFCQFFILIAVILTFVGSTIVFNKVCTHEPVHQQLKYAY